MHFELPKPPSSLQLGDINLIELTNESIPARYFAYAAVRDEHGSNLSILRAVGERLGALAQAHEDIRLISTPLLGTGAGGLEPVSAVEALTVGFRQHAPHGATLVLCTLHKTVFKKLEQRFSKSFIARAQPLRVFISYTASQDTDNSSWVEKLAGFLRNQGLDVRLDQWHLHRGVDLQDWMNTELRQAEKVIIVSDDQYAAKADGRLGGVGWETMLIQNDLARLPANTRKLLVLVRSPILASGTPYYLRGRFAIHCPPGTNIGSIVEELLKELYELDIAPPIGTAPIYL
jgi:hypothetical protein